MIRSKELKTKRAAVETEMRTLHNDIADGTPSDNQRLRLKELVQSHDDLALQIRTAETFEEADRRQSGESIVSTNDNRYEEMRARPDCGFLAHVALAAPNLRSCYDLGAVRELATEEAKRSPVAVKGIAYDISPIRTEQRTITTTTPVGGPGAKIIGNDYRPDMYVDGLEKATVMSRLGARVITGLTGDLTIPAKKSGVSAGWFAEGGTIGTDDMEFRQITATPKNVGVISEIGMSVLLQSSPGVEQLYRADFQRAMAEALDLGALQGGGSNEPVGLLSMSDLNDSFSMGTPTWAKVLEMVETVELENTDGTAWLTDPSVRRLLRSTPKVANTDSEMLMQNKGSLADYPLIAGTIVPTTVDSPPLHHLVFGDWSDLMVLMWGTIDLLVNPYEATAYSKGNILLRAIGHADVKVRHIESFVASADVAA